MRKVFYIAVDSEHVPRRGTYLGGDIYFVLADDPDEAQEHLREAIKKYYFKIKLASKAGDNEDRKRLGDRIIADAYITEETATAPFVCEDVTPMAYVYCEGGQKDWVDWSITLEDCNSWFCRRTMRKVSGTLR